MVAPRGPVTGLAKAGAAFIATIGVLVTLIGAVLILVGALGGTFLQDAAVQADLGNEFADVATTAFLAVGVFVLVLGVLHILGAIGAWRGSNAGRVLAVILAVIFGLLELVAATSASSSGTGGVITWVVAAGYIYTVIVLVFFWKAKPA